MGEVKQINIKNRTYYFCNDQINLKDFDARVLEVDKKDYKEIDIYYIGYVSFFVLIYKTYRAMFYELTVKVFLDMPYTYINVVLLVRLMILFITNI